MTLLRAEMLKLVRRRGLMIWSLLLTLGAVLVAEIIVIALHAANPGHHGPAGGDENLRNYVFLLGGLGNVAAIIIGATAGTQDVQNGVFRDLVVTGRKRSTLFNVRAPGALAVFLPMLLVGFASAVAVAFLLAGDRPKPTWHDVGLELLYIVLITGVDVVLAVGLSAFTSSRVVVGVLIAWNAIVSHLLISIHALGGSRKFIDVAAIEHFAPRALIDTGISMSNVTATLVVVGWTALFLWAGRYWTDRRDA